MERVTIPLASFRTVRAITAVVIGAAGVGTVVFAIAVYAMLATGVPFVSEGSVIQGLVGAALVLVFGALWVWPKLAPWLGWTHDPALVIEPDFVTIRHPGLGEPMVVPRQLIQVASVDTSPANIFTLHRRFAFEPGAIGGRPRSVLRARGIARLNLGAFPNVVVLFKQPLETVAPARRIRWGEHTFFKGGRSVLGVALAVSDPGLARDSFARLDLLRAISLHDVASSGLALTLR